jgi:DNA repair protein RadC
MKKISEMPKIERPREKLEKYGPEKLSNAELLAILLRSGLKGMNVVALSKKLLKQFERPSLAEVDVATLKRVFGLGSAKACEIVACFELGRRFLCAKPAALLLSPEDVWKQLKDIRESKKEHFVVFYLDIRNREIQREIVSVGTLSASLVHPREVFESAIVHHCAQILVAHNHPSGNLEPSEEDFALTKRLVEAGKLLGIEVLDHVIVSKAGYRSFREAREIQ